MYLTWRVGRGKQWNLYCSWKNSSVGTFGVVGAFSTGKQVCYGKKRRRNGRVCGIKKGEKKKIQGRLLLLQLHQSFVAQVSKLKAKDETLLKFKHHFEMAKSVDTNLPLSDHKNPKNPLKALNIFNEAKSRYPNYFHNDPIYATMINILRTLGRLSEMRDVIEQMRDDSCECNDYVCVCYQDIMVKENRLEMAHLLFVESSCGWEVRSQSCYPNMDSYAILMKGLCQDRRTLLDALCDAEKFEETEEVLGKILRKGLKAPKRCYNRLDLGQNSDGKDIESAKRMIHEALIKGSVPSLASCNTMAIDLYSEGKIDEADKVIVEMQESRGFKPTHTVFEAKVAALFKVNKVDEAIKVIEENMVKVNCLPIAKVYNVLLKNLCNVGNSTASYSRA
ncbi:Pentatricopeptide repeat-containing protein [Glycine soja]|uniref:Pentatricopeptide repeat-containing protein n=1 Tax=Glycine soja TaxID=3848 RepID=A0A0B2QZ53_GLYSO|nr:Pentatricopeptide repeat-containing protein [Glycine soja]